MSSVKLRHLHYKHGAYWYVRREGGRVRGRVGSLLLFARPDGQQLGASAVRNAWLKLVKQEKVEDARFHDLRGTCLTRAKEAGGLDYAQAVAGHTRQATTEGYIARRDATKVRPIR